MSSAAESLAPQVEILELAEDTMTFMLSNADTTLANTLRRVMIAEARPLHRLRRRSSRPHARTLRRTGPDAGHRHRHHPDKHERACGRVPGPQIRLHPAAASQPERLLGDRGTPRPPVPAATPAMRAHGSLVPQLEEYEVELSLLARGMREEGDDVVTSLDLRCEVRTAHIPRTNPRARKPPSPPRHAGPERGDRALRVVRGAGAARGAR